MSKWEKGALIMLNSWGAGWDNAGCIYVPYRLLQITGRSAEFYYYAKNYSPERVMKIAMNYSKREQIKVSVGIAADTNATIPDQIIDCDHFKFAGNGSVPMLGTWADGKSHAESMQFGFDLTDLSFGFDTRNPIKYFLAITACDTANGTGDIDSMSVVDYNDTSVVTSVKAANTGVPIGGVSSVTYLSVVTKPSAVNPPQYILVPQSGMRVIAWDSQNSASEAATNILDGKTSTIWHTRYSPVRDSLPHWVVIDMGAETDVSAFTYTGRTDGGTNGMVDQFEFFVSDDTSSRGNPVVSGELTETSAAQRVILPSAAMGRYVKFLALSSCNGLQYTSMSEFNLYQSVVGNTAAIPATRKMEKGISCVQSRNGLTMLRFGSPRTDAAEINVLNASGRSIVQTKGSIGTSFVSLGHIGSGCYFVRISSLKGTSVTRLLVP